MIKTLLKSMRQYKKVSWATIFFSTFEVVFEIVIPLCMSGLIDNGIEGGVMSMVWKYGLALLFLAVFQMVTGMLAAFLGSRASAGFGANLRSDMYDNVQTFAFSNIDKFSTASIVTRLTTDVTNIQNAYQMLIRIAIRGPVMLIFAMIVSFRIDSQISLMFIAIIPILAALLVLIIIKVHHVFKRVFHTYDELNNVVQENVRGIRVVKSFNQEDHEISKFEKIQTAHTTEPTPRWVISKTRIRPGIFWLTRKQGGLSKRSLTLPFMAEGRPASHGFWWKQKYPPPCFI